MFSSWETSPIAAESVDVVTLAVARDGVVLSVAISSAAGCAFEAAGVLLDRLAVALIADTRRPVDFVAVLFVLLGAIGSDVIFGGVRSSLDEMRVFITRQAFSAY
jgi:hypothetical protein